MAGAGGGTGWSLTGNAGTIAGTNFLGTTDSRALDFRVENARALRLEPRSGYPNLLGGYVENATGDSARGAAVGGSGQLGEPNIVTDNFGTVGGGANNRAGNANGIPGDATFGTVGGGRLNQVPGGSAVVAGGENNVAAGYGAAVPGGAYNQSGGDYSLAAGRRSVVHGAGPSGSGDADGDEGTFVWSDGQGVPFTSTGPNQFLVQAQGGVGINTNPPPRRWT